MTDTNSEATAGRSEPMPTISPGELARLPGAQQAAYGFLARYGGQTRVAYTLDLKTFFDWCAQRWVDPLALTRPMVELYVRWMQEIKRYAPATVSRRLGTVCVFYRYAVIDGLLDRSPAEYVRRPHRPEESSTVGLSHLQFEAMLACSREQSVMDHALVVLLGMLGLRVGEACKAQIDELFMQHGHRVLLVHGKGGKDALMPLPPAVARAIDAATQGRSGGSILLSRVGTPMNRHAAARVINRTASNARIGHHVHPHVLRHAFVTTLLDAGVPLRDVQIAARHADPRTTTRYDRARHNLDRHAVYLLAAFMAGAT